MAPELKKVLKQLFIEHQDVFMWSHKEMPRINNAVIEHCLCVDHRAMKVKQKRQSFSIEKYVAIVEVVDHLLAAGFIRETHYPEWLSNVVLVKKASEK